METDVALSVPDCTARIHLNICERVATNNATASMHIAVQALEARDCAQRVTRILQREVAMAEAAKVAAEGRAAAAEHRAQAAEANIAAAASAAHEAIAAADRREAVVKERALKTAQRLGREQMRVRFQLLHNQAVVLGAHNSTATYFQSLAEQHLRMIAQDQQYADLFQYSPAQVQAGLQLQDVSCTTSDVFMLLPGRRVLCMAYMAYCGKCGVLLQAGPGDAHGRGNDWSVERLTCKGTAVTDHCLDGACSGRFKVPPM